MFAAMWAFTADGSDGQIQVEQQQNPAHHLGTIPIGL